MRVVALGDYQGLVAEYQLDGRPDGAQWVAVREHPTGDALVSALAGAPVIVAMRQRTPFGRHLFAQLPSLRLMVTTGMRNAAIDLQAATDHGVVVSGTGGPPNANTAELTWGLILSLARHLPAEVAAVRDGRVTRPVGTAGSASGPLAAIPSGRGGRGTRPGTTSGRRCTRVP